MTMTSTGPLGLKCEEKLGKTQTWDFSQNCKEMGLMQNSGKCLQNVKGSADFTSHACDTHYEEQQMIVIDMKKQPELEAPTPPPAPKPTPAPTPPPTLKPTPAAPAVKPTSEPKPKPSPEADLYSETAYGKSTCPSGYTPIKDEASCKQAQAAIKGKKWSNTKRYKRIQPGCFSHRSRKVWYNTLKCTKCPTHKSFSSLCKRVEA
jgi:hypothetical protein